LWDAPLPHRQQVEDIHVAVLAPLNATREAHVVGHQTTLRAGKICVRHGLPVSDPATTWLALAPRLRLHDLVAVGDHLAHIPPPDHPVPGRPYLTLDELDSRVRRFRGRGKSRASEALHLISTRAESRPETLLRLLLHDAQFPVPEVNPEVLDARGRRIGRADLLFRSQRVIVEYDGDQHRTDSVQYEKDMTRLERFHRANWTVIRVRKQGLFVKPWSTVRLVARALSGED
ncbi:MAG: hypothetical protein JWR01_1368, partial [Subtercola sp.]|nr:hypothetical protein [Subtercola sp.]